MTIDEKDIQDLIGVVDSGGDTEFVTDDSDSEDMELDSLAADEDSEDTDNADEDTDSTDDSSTDEIAQLKARIAELENPAPTSDEPATEEPDVMIPVVDDLQDVDFFTEHSMQEVLEDEDVFKTWFADSINKVRKADRDSIMQMVYKNLPAIIQKHVIEQVENKSGADKFYADNPDLASHKKRVAIMANTVKEMFPELSGNEFLSKVADMTRQAVGLEKDIKEAPAEKPGKKTKPALVSKSVKAVTKRNPPEELDSMEKEIQDLLNVI